MINVALVGFGLAGKTFHAPLIHFTRGLNLKLVISSRKDEVQTLYPEVEVSSSFDYVLKSDIDLVIIATPNHLHFEQCQKALNAEKHVVVDKPFAQTVNEAKELQTLATKKNKVLSIFHNRRFDGDFLTLKEIVSKSKLGKISYFESNFNRFRPKVNKENWRETTSYAGGIFFDLAPHLIDQCIDLFGEPNRVLADIQYLREGALNDDAFHIIFEYEGMRAHLNASTLCANNRERFMLHGDEDSFSKFGMDVQENQLKAGITPSKKEYGKDESEGIFVHQDNIFLHTGEYQSFYENIAKTISGEEELLITSEAAIRVMVLMEKCLESSDQKIWIKNDKEA